MCSSDLEKKVINFFFFQSARYLGTEALIIHVTITSLIVIPSFVSETPILYVRKRVLCGGFGGGLLILSSFSLINFCLTTAKYLSNKYTYIYTYLSRYSLP